MKCSNCGKYVDNSAVRSGKRTACPKCGNQLDQPPSPKRGAGLLGLHRVLFAGGLVCLITGIILTIKLDQSGQSLGSGLIGLAIVVAIADYFVWRKYKKEAVNEEDQEGEEAEG